MVVSTKKILMIPLENYYHRAGMMLANIKVSGRSRAKRLGIKHDHSHVKVCIEELSVKLQKTEKLICCFCDTPIKIWESGRYACISCDRHLDPRAPYSIENIRFTHHRCNTQDGAWRHCNKKTVEDFRKSLTNVGVKWVPANSAEADEIFEKNQEYFRSSLTQQIKLETKSMQKNTDNKLERIVISGVQYELEPRRVEWYLLALKNAPHQSAYTFSSVACDSKSPASVSDVCRWIETLTADTDITTQLVEQTFGERIHPLTRKKILCSILKTKKGKRLIRRESSGVYRRAIQSNSAVESTVV